MAHTLQEASKLSKNPLASGVIKAIATTDELLAMVSMQGQVGEAYNYNREKALPTANFVDPNINTQTIAESSATTDKVTNTIRQIVDDVDISIFSQEQQGETNNQRGIQLEKKVKAVGRKIGERMISGAYATSVTVSATIAGTSAFVAGPYQDSTRHGPGSLKYNQAAETMQYRGPGDIAYGAAVSSAGDPTITLESDNPSMRLTLTVVTASLPGADVEILVRIVSTTNEIDGLLTLIPASQTVAPDNANGDALSFGVLDTMIDQMVKCREQLAFVMPGILKKQYHALLRGLGGATPETFELNGRKVPMYRQIPILQSDWMPTDEVVGSTTDATSVLLISLEKEEGFSLRVGAQGAEVTVDADPRATRVMGVKIREIGELEDKEATRDRVSWYGATHLGSELAVARASGITTS